MSLGESTQKRHLDLPKQATYHARLDPELSSIQRQPCSLKPSKPSGAYTPRRALSCALIVAICTTFGLAFLFVCFDTAYKETKQSLLLIVFLPESSLLGLKKGSRHYGETPFLQSGGSASFTCRHSRIDVLTPSTRILIDKTLPYFTHINGRSLTYLCPQERKL